MKGGALLDRVKKFVSTHHPTTNELKVPGLKESQSLFLEIDALDMVPAAECASRHAFLLVRSRRLKLRRIALCARWCPAAPLSHVSSRRTCYRIQARMYSRAERLRRALLGFKSVHGARPQRAKGKRGEGERSRRKIDLSHKGRRRERTSRADNTAASHSCCRATTLFRRVASETWVGSRAGGTGWGGEGSEAAGVDGGMGRGS